MLLQVTRFAEVLDSMAAKVERQAHQVEGPLAIAGKLSRSHVKGTRNERLGVMEYLNGIKAQVFFSDTATIQSGAWVVRTVAGSQAYGRTHVDHFAYVPFMSGRAQNPCVMKIDQILLIKRADMGWPGEEARVAVGTIWDHLTVAKGAGLETRYNDDPAKFACSVPRGLWCSKDRRGRGYPWAVHLRQIHCPVAYIPGDSGDMFVTLSKMGFNGRKDLFYT